MAGFCSSGDNDPRLLLAIPYISIAENATLLRLCRSDDLLRHWAMEAYLDRCRTLWGMGSHRPFIMGALQQLEAGAECEAAACVLLSVMDALQDGCSTCLQVSICI